MRVLHHLKKASINWRTLLPGVVRRTTLITLALLSLIFSQIGWTATLGQMDEILTRAKDLKAFLHNQALIDEYYEAAADYYGRASFGRPSYDQIIAQMRVVADQVPGFAERAWETHLGQAFSVTSAAPTFGKTVDSRSLGDFITHWKSDLKAGTGDLASIPQAEAKGKLTQILAKLKSRIEAKEKELDGSSLRAREKKNELGRFIQSLRNDPGLHQASSFLLLDYLNSPAANEVFESGSADLILNTLNNLKDQPGQLLTRHPELAEGSMLASSLKAALPDVGNLLREGNLFPVQFYTGRDGKKIAAEAGPAGTWNFRPAPRRFHAFFKGINHNECIGGGCGPDRVGSTTPARWATVALEDTEFHFIEKGGKLQGWIQATPVTEGGHTYASVDFGSPAFRQMILEKTEDGTLRASPMLNSWLRQAMKHKPSSWKGFVVGDTSAINNGGALPAVRASPAFLLGDKYDQSQHPFSHGDPMMAKALSTVIPRGGRYASSYGTDMIFDASVPGIKTLTVLKPIDRSLYQLLKAAIDRQDHDYVNQVLGSIHRGSLSHYGEEIEILRQSGVFNLLHVNQYQLPQEEIHYSVQPKDYVSHLLSQGMSLDEIKIAQRLMSRTVPDSMEFNRALVDSASVHDAPSLLKAIEYEVKSPSNEYKNEMMSFRGTLFQKFIGLNPSATEYEAFWKLTPSATPEEWATFVTASLKSAKTADEFGNILSHVNFTSTRDWPGTVGVAIQNSWDHLKTLSPEPDHLGEFAKYLAKYQKNDSSTYLEVKMRQVLKGVDPEKAATTKEFLAIAGNLPDPGLGENSTKAQGLFRGTLIENFLARDPSFEQIEEFRKQGPRAYRKQWTALWLRRLSKAPTVSSYLEIFQTLRNQATDESWRNSLLSTITDTQDHLFKLSPPPSLEEMQILRSQYQFFQATHTSQYAWLENRMNQITLEALSSSRTFADFTKTASAQVKLADDTRLPSVKAAVLAQLESRSQKGASMADFSHLKSLFSDDPSARKRITMHALQHATQPAEFLETLDPGQKVAEYLEAKSHFEQLSPSTANYRNLADAFANEGASEQVLTDVIKTGLIVAKTPAEALSVVSRPIQLPGEKQMKLEPILRANFNHFLELKPDKTELSQGRKLAFGLIKSTAACLADTVNSLLSKKIKEPLGTH